MSNKENKYDVAVIGAGPAGSMLAFSLAKNGIKVVLVDKEKFPRNKVCAGGLPPRVLDILPFDIKPVIEKEIFEVTLKYKLKDSFHKTYNKPLMFTVDRRKFDYFLVQKAKWVGADWLDGQKVTNLRSENNIWIIKTTDIELEATIVVGADGANGLVAKELSLRPSDFFHNGLQMEVPIESFADKKWAEKGIVLDWGRFEDSYGWVFPKQEVVSIGVQGPLKMGNQLTLYLHDLLSHYGISSENQNLTGHLIPHRIYGKATFTERALLIGDAAGLVDFWTGEGIYYAIKSALIAAKQIKEYLNGQTGSLNGYMVDLDRDIGPEIKTSYQFSKIFNYLSLPAFKVIQKYDYPWDVFCRIMRGDRTFQEVKKRSRPDILFTKLFIKSRRGNHGSR